MLERIRQNVRNPWIQAALVMVIVVFVLFFGWGMKSQRPAYVAKVDGEPINYRAYQQAYNGLLRIYQDAFKDNLTAERLRQLNLGRRALDQIVDQTLLLQDADRRGFTVDDAELRQAIEAVSAFQGGAGFDQGVYLRVLEANRITPLEFEASKRREILLQKLDQLIRSEATVSDAEVEAEYRDRNTRVALDVARFDPADLEVEVQADDEQLADFYEAEKETFRTPEKRAARYTLFAPDAYAGSVEVSAQEVEDEYNWRAEEFMTAEAVKARHLLLRLPPDAKPEAEEALRARIEGLRTQILGGADFAALADQHSDDPGSKGKGGELGFFERGRMVPEFEEVAFRLPVGEVSEPVKTPFGYHLILVEEHRQATRKPLDEVRAEIEQELRRRKALEEAYAAADNALMDLEDRAKTWDDLGASRSVETSALIADSEPLTGVEKPTEFRTLLFELTPDAAGNLLETPKGTYLLAVAEVQAPQIPPLDEVRSQLEGRYRKAEAKRLARERAEAFLEAAREQGWKEALAARNAAVETTDLFAKKGGALPKLGWSPDLKEAAFETAEVGTLLPDAYEVSGAFLVARVAAREAADLAQLEEQRETLRGELLPTKQSEHFQAYLESLKSRAAIEINEELLL